MTGNEFESFIERACREAHPALTEWYGADGLRDNCRQALQLDVLAMNEGDRARRLRDRHAALGVGVEAYLPRVIEVEPNSRAIAQICFDADSLTFPHVLVKHRDCAIDSAEQIESLKCAVLDAFASFGVERICLYRQAGDQRPEELPNLSVYKRYLAAPIDVITDRAPPEHADRVRLVPTRTVDFYDEYLEAYDAVWEENPALRDLVRKETLEDMIMYAEADGLRLVYIDQEKAGVMAAQPECEQGLRGWCIHERLIFTPFRGRGFGRAVLWHFMRSLSVKPGEVMYGTIVPANEPSIRSALRMGRIDVGQSYWLPVT